LISVRKLELEIKERIIDLNKNMMIYASERMMDMINENEILIKHEEIYFEFCDANNSIQRF
jgi:hypothetical protein